MEEPLVTRLVHASSLLSPRFIRGLGIQELLSCGGLLLPVLSRLVLTPHLCTLGEVMGRESLRGFSLFSVASPASSLHARRGGEASECHSSLGPPWPPDLRLGRPGGYFEPALGRMALVCGLVAHAVALLAMLGSAVETLWAWIVSLAVFPCSVAVRSLAVYRPLTVSQRSL